MKIVSLLSGINGLDKELIMKYIMQFWVEILINMLYKHTRGFLAVG